MVEDDLEETKDEKEFRESLKGFPYLYKDVRMAIFENETTFPHSISFLIKVPLQTVEAGILICTNPYKGTYVQRALRNRKMLEEAYKDSKKKILSRKGIILGWEGEMLLNGTGQLN